MSELDDIERDLWGQRQNRGEEDEVNTQQIFEQYKICIEMADKISERRGTANTFFLTFNTTIVGALSAFYKDVPSEAASAFFAATIVLCVTWAFLLRSYRTLNTAKFKIIGLLERRLPASPFWSAEWQALGEGKDWRKHIPLGPIETIVPVLFILVYLYLMYLKFFSAGQ
jgi:hypothetical protein